MPKFFIPWESIKELSVKKKRIRNRKKYVIVKVVMDQEQIPTELIPPVAIFSDNPVCGEVVIDIGNNLEPNGEELFQIISQLNRERKEGKKS